MKKRKISQGSSGRPDYLTTAEAAHHAQVSIPSIRNWIRTGQLRASTTPGRHRRIAVADFQQFLREHGLPPYPVRSSELRILIADDESEVVDLLVDYLRGDARRFKLETAMDGYEALIKIGSFKPSIVILDVVMPRLDGVEVCRRLKANPETRNIKILGVTGYPDRIPALLEAGADACVTKPMDLAHVRQELERLLVTGRSTGTIIASQVRS